MAGAISQAIQSHLADHRAYIESVIAADKVLADQARKQQQQDVERTRQKGLPKL
jgi:hypothetical protein